jgi:hypothetical protein
VTVSAELPGWLSDAIDDARHHGGELLRNNASEFSIGRGQITPWVARTARTQRATPQPPDDYGTPYRGTTPPTNPETRAGRGEAVRMVADARRARGSKVLGRFLRSNG